MHRFSMTLALAAASGLATLGGAQAQDYPTRTITMVVPFSPGGATDIIGRVIAQGLSNEIGQSVVVENVAGAGGSLGAAQAARAEADGYTLLMGALTSHSINMTLPPPPGFDLQEDFEPVALAGSVGLAVVTAPNLGAETLEDLLEMIRANPGGMTYASSGAGSPLHLGMEMLKSMADIDVVHVPYQGSAPALTDVMGGHIDMIMDTVPSIMPAAQSGTVRLLAVTTLEPSPFLEGTPTIDESGIEGFDVRSWFGVLAPAGTPEEITTRLNEAVNNVLESPDTIAALERQGVVPSPGTPADQAELITEEIAKWRAVIEEVGTIE